MEKLKVDSGEEQRAERVSGSGGPAEATNPEIGQAEEGTALDAPPASHGKMATPDAPPGLELDEHGDPVPLSERTETHRAEAQALKP